MADKKLLDEDGVSQFAEETKKYVDKHADNADIHVTAPDKANWNAKQGALTAEQLAAVNSGINATDKGNYDTHIANADIHVTAADKANWNGKQDALTSQQIDNINDVVNKANASDLTAHTNNSDIHVTTSDKTRWNGKQNALSTAQLNACNSGITSTKVATYDGYASSISSKANASDLTAHTNNSDIHVTTSDKANWNGKQDALTSQQLANIADVVNKANASDLTAHTSNADIHVTAADKTRWNGKQDALSAQQLSNLADVVNKANASDLTAHTSNADIHVTSTDKSNWNGKQNALSSQQIANINDVVNKANDSDVVHKTGDETAAGVKTFSDGVVGNVTGNASSATKLQTARTINGTSFNGTANITTANWGTARNISITDGTNTSTAVSVNGSKAYSLNLPSTIKATFVGNITGNVTGNADTSTKATNNASGNALSNDIIKGLSVNGKVITYTKLDGSTGTITTQDTNTTYSNFVKSGSGAKAGLVPAPSTTAGTTKYLREDGTWQVPPDHTYTVNNATLTIQKNGTTVKTFTANASANVTANIVVPTKTSELTNDSGFLTTHNPVDNALSSTSTNAVQNKVINTALNAKADVSDLSNYFPLSGGTLTGTVIQRNADNSVLQLRGASTYSKGAYLSLYGESSSTPGEFNIVAHTQTASSELLGTPDGSLTWGSKNIDVIEEQGNGFIRYSNGLQICWGRLLFSSGFSVVFAKPFSNQISVTATIIDSATLAYVSCEVASYTGATFKRSAGCWAMSYMAIGTWK